jgi:hypothetical protein
MVLLPVIFRVKQQIIIFKNDGLTTLKARDEPDPECGPPVGIGAHRIETIKRCVNLAMEPDFWMKDPSSSQLLCQQRHSEWYDNIYCFNPDETDAFMKTLPQPWIAFKVLAAGALKPQDAFNLCFSERSDFICVGMYDFQMVDNVNTALKALDSAKKEKGHGWHNKFQKSHENTFGTSALKFRSCFRKNDGLSILYFYWSTTSGQTLNTL